MVFKFLVFRFNCNETWYYLGQMWDSRIQSASECRSVPANIEYLYIRIYGFVYSVYSNMGFNRYPPYSKLRVFLVILYIPYSISGYPLTPNIEYGVYGNLYIRYSGIPLTPNIEYGLYGNSYIRYSIL